MNILQNLWHRFDRWVARALEPEFETPPSIAEARPRNPPHHPRVS